MSRPVITLLSDFGLGDIYVGVLHGVIARRCPDARVIDVTHAVPRGDVRAGALALLDAIAFLPVGVHLAVVDPGVGSARRAIAVGVADGRRLVGPDNGLLGPAAERAGGVVEAVEISASPESAERVSATFHGRDVFAPVAAALAAGRSLAEVGERLDPGELVTLGLPDPEVADGELTVTVTAVDHFGNLSLLTGPLDADRAGLEPGAEIGVEVVGSPEVAGPRAGVPRAGAGPTARFVTTFTDVPRGGLLLHEDSNGRLALAVNGARADRVLGAGPGSRLRLSR